MISWIKEEAAYKRLCSFPLLRGLLQEKLNEVLALSISDRERERDLNNNDDDEYFLHYFLFHQNHVFSVSSFWSISSFEAASHSIKPTLTWKVKWGRGINRRLTRIQQDRSTIMILIKDDQKLYLVSAVGLVFARKDKNPLGLEIGCAIAHYIITSSPVDWNNKELNYSTPTSPFLCQKKKMPWFHLSQT